MQGQSNQRGFTLIETFVAISVLMVALVGPLTLAQQSLKTASISSDQITAFYLAQDAMEYVKNIRDTNIRSGVAWLSGMQSCISAPGSNKPPCSVETTKNQNAQQALKPCGGEQCRLLFDAQTKKYGYSVGEPSQFWRETKIQQIDANREVLVITTVTWQRGTFTGKFTTSQSLFNIF